MAKDNQENTGFSETLGEHDYSTKFTLVGRSQTKYIEDYGLASGNIESIEIAAMSIPGAVLDLGGDAANKGLAGFDTIFPLTQLHLDIQNCPILEFQQILLNQMHIH